MRDSHYSEITEEQIRRSIDRGHLVLIMLLLVSIVIVARAFYVQIVQHNYYTKLGNKQYVSSVPINFDRGTIFFSRYKGSPVPAAQLKTTYRIAIDPTQIKDAEAL
ncbi:MAG: hypothetical protein K9L31_00950, partial [Candidatus Pacebacteria bacterium]|nr:hypothetical protein [Candidatus Paceibacterota bacterium]